MNPANKKQVYPIKPSGQEEKEQYLKGRGAQINTQNRFLKEQLEKEHIEGIDEWTADNSPTQYIEQEVKSIVNKVESPDVGMSYSMNPYAGCEHGCIYCYARNVHEYWGYSAGLDFERKIIVKTNAPAMLRKFLLKPGWDATPISISGNTDCYQPAEQKYRLTRRLLQVCLEFNQPVGLISKNAGMLRDLDVLQALANKGLVSVMVTITSLNEDLRRSMEPRTSTSLQRLRLIEELNNANVPAGVMMGPMIPGLNDHEMEGIMKEAHLRGARFSAYTFVRLNGAVKILFHDWLYKNFPDRADKVWHQIEASHNGKVNDSRWHLRMRGEGPIADLISQQYHKFGQRYHLLDEFQPQPRAPFRRPGEQGTLF